MHEKSGYRRGVMCVYFLFLIIPLGNKMQTLSFEHKLTKLILRLGDVLPTSHQPSTQIPKAFN